MKSISEIINSFAAPLKCSLQHKCCQKTCQRNSTTVNCNVNAHRKINESENLFCSVFILCGNLHYIWCCQAQINSFPLDVRSFWRCSKPNAVRNKKSLCTCVYEPTDNLSHALCLLVLVAFLVQKTSFPKTHIREHAPRQNKFQAQNKRVKYAPKTN